MSVQSDHTKEQYQRFGYLCLTREKDLESGCILWQTLPINVQPQDTSEVGLGNYRGILNN